MVRKEGYSFCQECGIDNFFASDPRQSESLCVGTCPSHMFQNYTVNGQTYKFCVQNCSAPNILLSEYSEDTDTLCLSVSDIDKTQVYVAKADQHSQGLHFLFTCKNYFPSDPKKSLSGSFDGKL